MDAFQRIIAHFDIDSFFVSVERLKDSSLVGKPIAVGGHSDRGVIASCSYEARKMGVRSAMPTRQAKKLCPELIMVKGDMGSYSTYSRMVTDIIAAKVPLFEKSSIDEFYIDMSGMDRFFGASQYTARLRDTIVAETGLSISYGVSTNKLISKVATNEVKPQGQIEVPPGAERAYLAPLPIDKLPMVGAKTAELLRKTGVHTIGNLSDMNLDDAVSLLGKNGSSLWRRANGIDNTPVHPWHEQKSIGTENTFHSDSTDLPFLHTELARMTEKVGFELRDSNKLAGCITVKIRYNDFDTQTIQSTLAYTAADHVLLTKAKELFAKLHRKQKPVRLLGVRLSQLVQGNYQISLFEDSYQKIKLYQAIDSVKHQFGEKLLIRAAGLRPKNDG